MQIHKSDFFSPLYIYIHLYFKMEKPKMKDVRKLLTWPD